MVPKDVCLYTLILGTCEDATFHDKKDFADMVDNTDFEMARLSGIIQVGPIMGESSLKAVFHWSFLTFVGIQCHQQKSDITFLVV